VFYGASKGAHFFGIFVFIAKTQRGKGAKKKRFARSSSSFEHFLTD
jgi:hypothetical protein